MSDEKLFGMVSGLEKFGSPLLLNHKVEKVLAIIGLSLLIIGLVLSENRLPYSGIAFVGMVMIVGAAAAAARQHLQLDRYLVDLTPRIEFQRAVNCHPLTLQRPDPVHKAAELSQSFNHIFRGHDLRRVPWLLAGRYEGPHLSFDYEYVKYWGLTRAKNKDDRDRVSEWYGFLVSPTNISRAKNVAVQKVDDGLTPSNAVNALLRTSRAPQTTSRFVNKNFRVTYEDELELTQFLKPVVLETLETAFYKLDQIGLRINKAGHYCLNVGSNMLQPQINSTLKYPSNFRGELEEYVGNPKFKDALEFLHEIVRYSDHNFRPTTKKVRT